MFSRRNVKRFIDMSIRRAVRDESAWDNYRNAVNELREKANEAAGLINSPDGIPNKKVANEVSTAIRNAVSGATRNALEGGSVNLGKAQGLFLRLKEYFQSLKKKYFFDNPELDATGVAKKAKTLLNEASKKAELASGLAFNVQRNIRNNGK